MEKKTKLHENAIYAINNNLKRLKYKHKDVSQVVNFNKYIEYHRTYSELCEKFLVSSSFKEKRGIYESLYSLRYCSGNYAYPNLYHYSILEIQENIDESIKTIYEELQSYNFIIFDSNQTVNDNNGEKIFKTANEMWRTFKSYHDIDSTAKLIFDDVTYYPSNIKDCEKIFDILSREENNED